MQTDEPRTSPSRAPPPKFLRALRSGKGGSCRLATTYVPSSKLFSNGSPLIRDPLCGVTMRVAVSSVLLIVAALALLPTLAIVESIPIEIAEYGREPEDLVLLIFWLLVCVLLASTCITGALLGFGKAGIAQSWPAKFLVAAATVVGAVLALASILDVFDREILAPIGGALIATGVALAWLRRPGKHAA